MAFPDMMNNQHRETLEPGYKLHWYHIKSVLGRGAFGVTYLADDINLNRPVAIKEFIPSQIASRGEDGSVQPLSSEYAEDFKWGLERFISEARTLTKFEHPNLVRVYSVFEANNTAYMIMNYETGTSLQKLLRANRKFNETELINILLPLMSGLEAVHEKGFIHRDIKPGNIYIRKDGTPVLLDFGSARQVRGRSEPVSLTQIVSEGYAPIEQYATRSELQGPWTDIYGLAATLYKAVTGELPVSAMDRSETIIHTNDDKFVAASKLAAGEYSQKFLAAIDYGMKFRVDERPQDIATWRKCFSDKMENNPQESAEGGGDDNDEYTKTVALSGIGNNNAEMKTELLSDISREATTIDAEAETVPAAPADNEGDTQQIKTADIPELDSEVKTRNLSAEKTIALDTGETLARDAAKTLALDTEETLARDAAETLALDGETIPDRTAKIKPGTRAWYKVNNVLLTGSLSVILAGVIALYGLSMWAGGDITSLTSLFGYSQPASAGKDVNKLRINALLALADQDLNELRLTTPPDRNARDKYMQVLALDKNNARARQGLNAITDKYLQMVYQGIEQKQFDLLDDYLDRAEQATPGSYKVAVARKALKKATAHAGKYEAKQEDKSSPNGVLGFIKKIFKDPEPDAAKK